MPILIGIVDDHRLFLESLTALLTTNNSFNVVVTAVNGKDLQTKMNNDGLIPDIMLVDVNMPQMNGFQTTAWLKDNYPNLKIVALSMKDDEFTIIRMLRAGCCSYLLKDIDANELENALFSIHKTGHYNGDVVAYNSREIIISGTEMELLKLTEREMEFLNLACSDLSYNEIANIMSVSERTVDRQRENLFAKLKVTTRVGLCLEAVRLELVEYKRNHIVGI